MIKRAYGKKMAPKEFEVGDIILQENISNTTTKDELKRKKLP